MPRFFGKRAVVRRKVVSTRQAMLCVAMLDARLDKGHSLSSRALCTPQIGTRRMLLTRTNRCAHALGRSCAFAACARHFCPWCVFFAHVFCFSRRDKAPPHPPHPATLLGSEGLHYGPSLPAPHTGHRHTHTTWPNTRERWATGGAAFRRRRVMRLRSAPSGRSMRLRDR